MRELLLVILVILVGCGSGGGFPDAAIHEPPGPPGELSISWSLTNQSGAPLTCQAANATTVLVGITDPGGARNTASFDCGLGTAVSGALFVAMYDVDFTLIGTAGILATAPAQHGVAITSSRVTKAASVAFVVMQ